MTEVLTPALAAFLEATPVGVLGVKRKDGTVHQSLVYHLVRDGKIYISTEPTRLKGRAIVRDGWASYAVRGDAAPYPAFSVEGPATLLQGEGIAELTSAIFLKIFGKAGDPLTDDQVRAMNRAVIELTPEKVYAVSYFEA